MSICKHCGRIGGMHAAFCRRPSAQKIRGRRAKRIVTHNENACKGQHCAECTPSTKTPQHRAEVAA